MSGIVTVVGSYPQPDWLIDRERLGERLPPRVRARELWRVPEPFLEHAQDDATRLAVADMERAGVDVITDGEMRRESYSNRFATALEGVDLDEPGVALDRTGHENPVPRVVGPIRRARPVETRDVEFLRSLTDRRIKITVPGPFTMTQQAQNDHYSDDRSLALAYAEAVNEELRDRRRPGPISSRSTSPTCRRGPRRRANTPSRRSTVPWTGSRARPSSTPASATRTSSTSGCPATPSSTSSPSAAPPTSRSRRRSPISTRSCCGRWWARRSSSACSTWARPGRDARAGRGPGLRRALEVVSPERLVAAPDCGMKYLPRERAFRKLEAMVAGARLVSAELAL